MGFITLLLIAIIWLLWTIHQDLTEANDRQHSLKTAITKLVNRLEQNLELDTAPAKKSPRKTTSKKAPAKIDDTPASE